MALTTTSEIAELTISLKERALVAVHENSVFAPNAPYHRLLRSKLLPQGSLSTQFNVMSTLTMYDVTDGVDHTNSQALDPTGTSVTATERIALTTITDLARAGSIEDLIEDAGRELGIAAAAKWDTDVFALGASLSTNAGTTGTDTTSAMMAKATKTLRVNHAPPPYYAFLHPYQWNHLVAEQTLSLGTATGGAGTLGEEVLGNYFVVAAPVWGTRVIVTTNVPSTNSAADHGGVVLSSRPAWGCVKINHPDGGLWINRIEMERDISLRGGEVAMTSAYGVGEIEDAMGVEMASDYETS